MREGFWIWILRRRFELGFKAIVTSTLQIFISNFLILSFEKIDARIFLVYCSYSKLVIEESPLSRSFVPVTAHQKVTSSHYLSRLNIYEILKSLFLFGCCWSYEKFIFIQPIFWSYQYCSNVLAKILNLIRIRSNLKFLHKFHVLLFWFKLFKVTLLPTSVHFTLDYSDFFMLLWRVILCLNLRYFWRYFSLSRCVV